MPPPLPTISMSSSPRPLAGVVSLLLAGALAGLIFSFASAFLDGGTIDSGKGRTDFRFHGERRKSGDGASSFRRWLSESDGGSGSGSVDDLFGTIHTFFSPIDPRTRLPTDKLNVTDMAMLESWRASWESQGWRTRILTIEDARSHPRFKEFDRMLEGVPLGANAYYNRLCFLRWLAMAAVGGGFMSDYDTVPLRSPPTITGEEVSAKFAVYGSGVPSLVSGTQAEWERMARQLLDTALELTGKEKRNLWSDMMILQHLNQKNKFYVMRHETLQGKDALKRKGFTPTDCAYFTSDGPKRVGGFRVVHFSHEGLRSDQYPHRPEIMRDWIVGWSARCKGVELILDVPAIEAAKEELRKKAQEQHQEKEEEVSKPREGFSWEKLRQVTAPRGGGQQW